MRLAGGLAAFAILMAIGASITADDTVSIVLPQDTVKLAPGPGVDATERSCAMCHSLDYITIQPPGGAAQWQGVVAKMRTVFGAPISDEDAKTIVQYLAAHYGPR
jgi:cytochrome c5